MERWQKPEAEHSQGTIGDHSSRSSLDYHTPLRSARGDATSSPSPFYKLSAELSRESLRIPGAVPFIWEQSPGRRKFPAPLPPSSVISPYSIVMSKLQAGSLAPESANTFEVDPAKPNLATLFRQPSLDHVVASMPASADSCCDAPILSVIPQLSPPPAADHPRSSSARYSIMQRNVPPGTSFNKTALQYDNGDKDDAASEEDISDVFTATAGEGLSMDDSLVPSGSLRPTSTPSEARDFIMHRFLPAAHTIACESPQTPSRRFFLPVGVAAATCSPSTPARCNGSFRDYAAASRPSPLQYTSASSTPISIAKQLQPRGQVHTGSFRREEEEEEEDEEEEEPPFTPKACGIFPFHITVSFHNRHTNERSSRRASSSKHQHNKQQHQRRSSKSMNCAGTQMRIMDILHDDHSSSHDDESPVHRHRSKQSERADFMHAYSDAQPKPPFESYNRGSPNLHQLLKAQQAAARELDNEEASEYGSYQDAPSRFQSPSPAGFHLNARALRAYNYMQPPVASSITQRSRSFADHPSADFISTTEQHLLNSSFYNYNMQTSINKPHYQSQLANSPYNCHSPLASHVGAYHGNIISNRPYHDTTNINEDSDKADYHDITTNAEQWDASNQYIAPKTNVINNALYEYEDPETKINTVNANGPSMSPTKSEQVITYSPNCSRLVNQGAALNQAGPGEGHGYRDESKINGDHHMCIGDFHSSINNQHISNGGLHGGKLADHHMSNGNHYGDNGSHQGDHYVSNNYHYANRDDPYYMINVDNHVNKGVQYASNGNNHVITNGDMYASNGDVHGNLSSSFLSKSLLSPPLPKSPTHSWLDRAMPLAASYTNKSLGTASRLSHMHKATTTEDDHATLASMSKTASKQAHPSSTEASKWEALVKGSHLQPGHLRFSEELLHQSQSVMKVGAS